MDAALCARGKEGVFPLQMFTPKARVTLITRNLKLTGAVKSRSHTDTPAPRLTLCFSSP